MLPCMMKYPPMPIIPAEAIPNKKVEALVIKAVAVRLFFTFKNKRSTPFSKVFCSCSSALKPFMTRIPFKVSVKRPVTSALILPRSRKIGRMYPKAFKAIMAKMPTGNNTKSVIQPLMLISITREITAVMEPPMS